MKKYVYNESNPGAVNGLSVTIAQDIAEALYLGAITKSHVRFWIECDLRMRVMNDKVAVYVDIPEWDGTSKPKIITFADSETLENSTALCLDNYKFGNEAWENEWVRVHVK